MAEQHDVRERHQRGALPPRGHVARAEVAHHPHAHPLRDHRGIAELQSRATGLVPDRLAVRGDERHVPRRRAAAREELQDRAREAFAQRDVEQRQVLRAAARDRLDDLSALRRTVWLLAERDELGAERIVGEANQRGRDAVERRARHHPDGETARHRERTGGGSPTARRTNPPACSSSRPASSLPTRCFTITMASFTLPAAASIARRAAGRSTPPTSMTMRSPRSRSLSLTAIKSTIRLP